DGSFGRPMFLLVNANKNALQAARLAVRISQFAGLAKREVRTSNRTACRARFGCDDLLELFSFCRSRALHRTISPVVRLTRLGEQARIVTAGEVAFFVA